jgi:hypothetical protein
MPGLEQSLSALRRYQAEYDAGVGRGVVRTLNPDDPEWSGDES